MRETVTGHRRIHRVPSGVAGSQLTLDAYSHRGSASYRGLKFGDFLTDLNTGEVSVILRTGRAPAYSLTSALNCGVRGAT
jgi:hypothetical protein